MKRKFLSLMLALCIALTLFSTLPVSVSAATEGIYTYEIYNDKATIISCDKSVNGAISIPETLGGYPVTSIKTRAFSECFELTNVTIPTTVTDIGFEVFFGCEGLVNINVSENNNYFSSSDGVLFNKTKTTLISHPCGKAYSSYQIPVSVTSIGNSAFLNCSNLTSISIPNSVTSIGLAAFIYCINLASITIPNSVTSIGEMAFYSCTNLAAITIPDSVTSIGREAFNDTAYFGNENNWENGFLYIDNHLIKADELLSGEHDIKANTLTIAGNAFAYCTNLTHINIPDSVKSIGEKAFYKCTNLTRINIPDSVKSIGEEAFYGCESLADIIISDSVTNIGDYTFSFCISLTDITIPNGVTNIGEGAFSSCTNLTGITIQNGVSGISEGAFYGCESLADIAIPNSVVSIGDNAFRNCYILTVYYEGSETDWESISIGSGNEHLTEADIFFNAIKRTYKFTTNCDIVLPDITDYAVLKPALKKDNEHATLWYDNEALSGEPVTFPYSGSKTTLYAAFVPRTGESAETAFATVLNSEYTISNESESLTYFEFAPEKTCVYRFYFKTDCFTEGYLFKKNTTVAFNNNNGKEYEDFFISEILTAGEVYSIAVKSKNITNPLTFAIKEESDIYKMSSIELEDSSGEVLPAIPKSSFNAVIYLTLLKETDSTLILAGYSADGSLKWLSHTDTGGLSPGSLINKSMTVDNTDGEITTLKAFCMSSLASLTPIGNVVSFPAE